jgi:hypothetical protein
MNSKGFALLPLLALGSCLLAEPVFAAGKPVSPVTVKCGATDPTTKQPVRGTLVLNKQISYLSHAFKRSPHRADLTLNFAVSGCQLKAKAKFPAIRVLPANGASQLPIGAVGKDKIWDHDASTGTLVLTVDPKKLGGGSYAANVSVRAVYLTDNETKITVSKTDGPESPIVIGALAGVVGALWFFGLKITATQKLKVSYKWLPVLFVIAGLAGAWAAVTNYWGKDVWTFDDDWVNTAKLAFAAASTGSLATILAAVWQSPKAP